MALVQETETKKTFSADGMTSVERSVLKRGRVSLPFFVAFCEEIARLFDLTGNELKLFIKMAACMDYDNIVRLVGIDRKYWAKEMGITDNSFNVTLSRLMRSHGLIKRISQSAYMIDPEIFNKGDIYSLPEKAKEYNMDFRITLAAREDGFERKVKMKVSSPDAMKIDPETGECIYTSKGKRVPAPKKEEIVASYNHNQADDAVDVCGVDE